MSKGRRGVGLDKPCIKCGASVPSLYVSPVQPGLCGKCTDEATRAGKHDAAPQVKTVILEKMAVLKGILFISIGLVAGFALAVVLSGLAPGAWQSIAGPVQDMFK